MLKTIYALVDPRDGATRYIGATKMTLAQRLGSHVADARRWKTHRCSAWIRELAAIGVRPKIVALSSDAAEWQSAERAAIAKARLEGHDLLNQTDGGLGMLGCRPDEATKQKRSQALKRRYAADPAQMAARQDLARQAARSEGGRAAASARMKQIWSDPVMAAQMREAMRGKQKRSQRC